MKTLNFSTKILALVGVFVIYQVVAMGNVYMKFFVVPLGEYTLEYTGRGGIPYAYPYSEVVHEGCPWKSLLPLGDNECTSGLYKITSPLFGTRVLFFDKAGSVPFAFKANFQFIPSASGKNFENLGRSYFRDSTGVYDLSRYYNSIPRYTEPSRSRNTKVSIISPDTITIIKSEWMQYIKDDAGVYYSGKVLDGIDPKTFEVVMEYGKYGSTYGQYGGKGGFKLDLLKDKNGLYLNGRKLSIKYKDEYVVEKLNTSKKYDSYVYDERTYVPCKRTGENGRSMINCRSTNIVTNPINFDSDSFEIVPVTNSKKIIPQYFKDKNYIYYIPLSEITYYKGSFYDDPSKKSLGTISVYVVDTVDTSADNIRTFVTKGHVVNADNAVFQLVTKDRTYSNGCNAFLDFDYKRYYPPSFNSAGECTYRIYKNN